MQNTNELHDLVVFDTAKKKVLTEISISASSISKAVKKVKQNFEDDGIIVLQKSAIPPLGITSFKNCVSKFSGMII